MAARNQVAHLRSGNEWGASRVSREQLLVVGNGMAGLKLVEELVRAAPGRFAITVVGAEPEAAYNRVLLSALLAREVGPEDIALKPRHWYTDNGISLHTGRPAIALYGAARTVTLAGGERLPFDRLVLATGSDPIRLAVPGAHLQGVWTFRTTSDVASLQAAAQGARAVVIGGGLLGIEAAFGLACSGASVTLVHLMDRLMERQLDAEGAALLAEALEARGIRILLRAETAAFCGDDRVDTVALADGRRLGCDLVVMAVGVRPNTALAGAAGLRTGRGILVSDRLETSIPRIYAIGECAEHRGQCYGLVEPVFDQARALARILSGEDARYCGSLIATNLKVSGIPVFSAGDFEGGTGSGAIVLRDEVGPSYRKLVLRDGRLAGVVLVGDTADADWYLDLLRSSAPLGTTRETIAFGRAYAEAA